MTWRGRATELAPLALILTGAALLRLVNLDYAHFQGDEIKALFPPGAAFSEFLLSQRKGPGQFVVTWLVQAVAGEYNELFTRLPFALASLAGVLIVFLFVRDHWGRGPALLAAALVGSCGLLIAFGRIVQYQAFCMMLVLLTARAGFAFASGGAAVWLYLAAAAFGLGLLFHYDAATFAPTLCVLVVAGCWRQRHQFRRLAPHLIGALLVAVALAGVFYVPYALQPNFDEVTGYLLDRVAGERGLDTVASTRALLSLYVPPFYFAIIGPALIAGIAGLIRRRDTLSLALVFWFVTTFGFYMLLGGDPQSHVYNYFLPGLMIAAYGMWHVVELSGRAGLGGVVRAGVWIVLAAFGGAAWTMFVDHGVEHPWYSKTILGYTLPNLETRRIEGVFGFPYRRGLETVGELFDRGELTGTFDSNERDVMADFYFRSNRGQPADYYFFVHAPLSLERTLPSDVTQHYQLTREVVFNGRKTIDVYERVR